MSTNTSWKYRLGLVLFFGTLPIFFAAPVIIPMLGLSAAESAALIGGILLAVELLWFASIPLLGKEGFKAVKQRTFGWLKLPTSPVSQTRHRIGVMLLFGSLLLNVLLNLIIVSVDLFFAGPDQPNPVVLGLSFEQQTTVYIATQILTSIGVMVAMLMLGGDFWERLKKAFEWHG